MSDTSATTPVPVRIHRLGSSRVNFYVVEEGRPLTVVDAGGGPRHLTKLLTWLRANDRSIDDVSAVLLTHGHPDHVGFAAALADRGIPVYVHEGDLGQATGTGLHVPPPRFQRSMWRPYALGTVAQLAAAGIFWERPLRDPRVLRGAETLDLPGSPRVVPMPGHSPGSVAYVVPAAHDGAGAVLSGDSLTTLDPHKGGTGPLAFAEHPGRGHDAAAALAALRPFGQAALYPGHGEPWTDAGAVEAAVSTVRVD